MYIRNLLEVFQHDDRQKLYGIRDANSKQPLLMPNNDWLMFEKKEDAQKVCDLINKNVVF